MDPQIGVRDLVARYCAAVLAFDSERFTDCWTEDARWMAKAGTVEGIERIVKVFVRARGQFPLCVQEPLSTVVEQFDGGARASTQVREIQWLAGRAVGVELIGVYDDICVFDRGRWRFAQRSFTELYRGSRPLPGRLADPAAF